MKWCSHHSWRYLNTLRYLKDVQVWPFGTWFSGGLGRAALMVVPDDLFSLNDSVIWWLFFGASF